MHKAGRLATQDLLEIIAMKGIRSETAAEALPAADSAAGELSEALPEGAPPAVPSSASSCGGSTASSGHPPLVAAAPLFRIAAEALPAESAD